MNQDKPIHLVHDLYQPKYFLCDYNGWLLGNKDSIGENGERYTSLENLACLLDPKVNACPKCVDYGIYYMRTCLTSHAALQVREVGGGVHHYVKLS